MEFNIVVLGCNSAIPSQGRHPTAQVVNIGAHKYLIDAGEGTQLQCAKFRQSPMKISKIFISHLHGDHVYGLPGLLTTLNLQGRKKPLDIYGPSDLAQMILPFLELSCVQLNYPLSFHPVKSTTRHLLVEEDNVNIYAFPLSHKIETYGYLFEERITYRNLIPEMLIKYNIPKEKRGEIAKGKDWVTPTGDIIPNENLTSPSKAPRSYAYCSDTRYMPEIIPWISGVSLLYHEATYLHEMVDKADERGHSTALQAAEIAKQAGANKLLLGHFSSKYGDLSPLEGEARRVFLYSEVAQEGNIYSI